MSFETAKLSELRKRYPNYARVTAENDYHIPVGKEFVCARRKEGDGSPFPIEAFSFAGDYRTYQFTDSECELLPARDSHDVECSHPYVVELAKSLREVH